ncbi:MAG: TMAO reductase system periplasmic protein TorT [Undibacterium sp.]|uniref:TMAO reductase system periplasmic protein TorT n=1 Tax=Undibacterium sp. TaxID=1914977 RepID=UPI002727A395|nr:TMAO reductase system periplasmic protein TorT [Undibacterium sp.]MDO8652034.1 TMAO reductase system periplasmic protein TorT [Undibacterium sp.]
MITINPPAPIASFRLIFWCAALLGLPVMASATGLLPSAPSTPSVEGKFDPIPVFFIYPPLKRQGSADDALSSGRVINSHVSMAAPASKAWRIAFLFPHLKDPYWVGCAYGVMSEAKRLGVEVDIFPADGYNDLVGQLRKMDEAIAAKYDAIVISPLSQTANNPSIAKARAQGIPVFELANDSNSDDLTIKVTTSLKSMGKDALQWVIQDAQQRGLKSINIALLPGPADAGWVKGEVDGTREAASKAAMKVNILAIAYGDSDRIGQTQLAAQLISEYGKNLDYILGCTGCAPAAILPLKEAGLNGKIKIVAYDLTREIAGLIAKGDIVASVDTKGVSQARVTINAAVNFLEGRTKVLPHTILVKLGLVDGSNYTKYKFDSSTAPDGYTPILSYAPEKMK